MEIKAFCIVLVFQPAEIVKKIGFCWFFPYPDLGFGFGVNFWV
jgi:hypothetical protein